LPEGQADLANRLHTLAEKIATLGDAIVAVVPKKPIEPVLSETKSAVG
jgi:hypothetical protein